MRVARRGIVEIVAQAAPVRAILEQDGVVSYDSGVVIGAAPWGPSAARIDEFPPGRTWVRRLLGEDIFGNVTCVMFKQVDLRGSWPEHFDRLDKVQFLALRACAVR